MTGVVSITAKALGESKWTEQKRTAPSVVTSVPGGGVPAESTLRFLRGPMAASAVRLASLCLIWASSCCCIWRRQNTQWCCSNPPAFILPFGTEARVQRLNYRKIEILAEQVYIWVVVKLEKENVTGNLNISNGVCLSVSTRRWNRDYKLPRMKSAKPMISFRLQFNFNTEKKKSAYCLNSRHNYQLINFWQLVSSHCSLMMLNNTHRFYSRATFTTGESQEKADLGQTWRRTTTAGIKRHNEMPLGDFGQK